MENKESLAYKLLCTSCLCTGRTLLPVADERMRQYYIDSLKEVPLCNMPQVSLNICWECKALLKKAVSFREQVKDSYRILQTYTSEALNECLLTDITRPPRLKIHHTKPIIILVDDEPAFSSVTDDRADDAIDDRHRDLQKVYVKEELKVEIDNEAASEDDRLSACSDITDIETEIRTLVSKKEKKKRKKACSDKLRRAKKIVKKLKTGNKQTKRTTVGNNIITIELSYEDMLLERERESKRDSFVNAEYKCETCLIGFHYLKSFNTHMETKHNPAAGDYSCPLCLCRMSSIESFTTHYKRHMKRYECNICHKRTTDLKVMQQHYFSWHEVALQKYTCNVCGKVSDSIDRHRYHKDTHKARVQCNECDKTFSHRAGLMNHRLAVHELNNEFPCTVCEKVFRWKTSLKRHLEKHDAKDKYSREAAFCESCDIGFSSVASYQRHLRNSLKHVTPHQLRFICDHCNRRFADKTKLRDHIEEKHLHKTYQCPICMKPSKNRVGLDQHVRNVHRGRPHDKMCHHCGRGFPTKVQLESHIRTHTGERPFICEFCPTTFSQQSNLYKHNRQVHLNIKSKRYPPAKKRPPSSAPAPAPAHNVQYSNGFGMSLQ